MNLFAKKWKKELEMNETLYRNMCNEKRKRQITEGTEPPKEERIRMIWEKDKYMYWEILMKEKNNKKSTSTNKRISGNQTLRQKSHQRYKYLASIPCNILETIHKMGKERTQRNGPEDKKVNNDAQDRVCVKKKRKNSRRHWR